jgi:hypothetical protein
MLKGSGYTTAVPKSKICGHDTTQQAMCGIDFQHGRCTTGAAAAVEYMPAASVTVLQAPLTIRCGVPANDKVICPRRACRCKRRTKQDGGGQCTAAKLQQACPARTAAPPFSTITHTAPHLELWHCIDCQSGLACLRVTIPVLHNVVKPAGVAAQQAAQHRSATAVRQSLRQSAASLAGLTLRCCFLRPGTDTQRAVCIL